MAQYTEEGFPAVVSSFSRPSPSKMRVTQVATKAVAWMTWYVGSNRKGHQGVKRWNFNALS